MNKFISVLLLASCVFNAAISRNIQEDDDESTLVTDEIIQDFITIYKNETLPNIEETPDVTPDDMSYYFTTKENPEVSIRLNKDNPLIEHNEGAKYVILVHGWAENIHVQWYQNMKNALMQQQEHYDVIEVNWGRPAHQRYLKAVANSKVVGKMVGEFVSKLAKNSQIPMDQITMIGFAMGAHVSGYAGKTVLQMSNEKMSRIIAFDPARPIYHLYKKNNRLNSDDAKVVSVVHTNGGLFGFLFRMGTIDFFPNGGTLQPGCLKVDRFDVKGIADSLLCNHRRSYLYFIESLKNSEKYMSKKCESFLHFIENKCENEQVSIGDLLTTTQTGKFYLKVSLDSGSE